MNFHRREQANPRTKVHLLHLPPQMTLADANGLTFDLKEICLHITSNLLISKTISAKHLFYKNFSILKGSVIANSTDRVYLQAKNFFKFGGKSHKVKTEKECSNNRIYASRQYF